MKINTENKIYYAVCCTLAFFIAVIMIYRELPHGNAETKEEKEIHDTFFPQTVTAVSVPEEISTTQISTAQQTVTDGISTPSSDTEMNGDTYLININTADISTLMKLKGIGEKKAQNIIEYRDTCGKFQSTDELTNVPGIGKKTAESLKGLITVSSE